ncbi:hypothetical protein V2K50_03640 [Pseudomonas alliivorans]|nr:hypothetical protein [Pseudomonas alliivorans]
MTALRQVALGWTQLPTAANHRNPRHSYPIIARFYAQVCDVPTRRKYLFGTDRRFWPLFEDEARLNRGSINRTPIKNTLTLLTGWYIFTLYPPVPFQAGTQ